MKPFFAFYAFIFLALSSCTNQTPKHPYVEQGMSRAEVTDLMGTPIWIDSIQHTFTFNLGHMNADVLDSLGRLLDETDATRMIMGHPVHSSTKNDQVTNWYYGPAIMDTVFTYDSTASPARTIKKFWYVITKQRAVTFDVQAGSVTARGFVVVEVDSLWM